MTEQQEVSPFAGLQPGIVDYGKFSFTVKRYVLADLCERANAAVSSRAEGSPVLGCFQVSLGGGVGLQVAATDMERTVFAQTEAVAWDETAPPAQVYLPARKLVSILHEAPEGEVSVRVRKNKAEVSVSGASWSLQLPDSSPYPQLPDPSSLVFTLFSREALLTALRAIRHAICRDASRSNLTQVSFTEGVVTASDGSRLARSRLPAFPVSMCVPAAAVEDLVRLLADSPDIKDAGIAQTEGLVAFNVGHVVLAATKRQSAFPDMDAQLLKPAAGNSDVLAVDKSQLQSAIKRVRINADAATAAIALDISSGEVTVVSRDKSGNSAKEAVPAKWETGKRLVVVNHVHLAEAIASHPEPACEFRLGENVGKKPAMVLLEGGDLVQVLTQMPAALVGY